MTTGLPCAHHPFTLSPLHLVFPQEQKKEQERRGKQAMLTPLLRVLPVGRASSQMLYDPSVDPLWPEIKVRCRLQVLRRSPLLACVGMRSGHPLPTPAHSHDGRPWRPQRLTCAARSLLTRYHSPPRSVNPDAPG